MMLSRARLMTFAAIAAVMALATFTGGPAGRVAAQGISAGLTCSTGVVGLDTCLVTLNNGIPPGDSLTVALEAPGADVVGCQSFTPGAVCSASGDTLDLACPGGCPSGSQFQESVQVYAGGTLAQQLTISGPVTAAYPPQTYEPQMFGSCLSGVWTNIGCVPSTSYLSYYNCQNSWMQACSFDLGYGYSGYYLPSTATYAFYVPTGDYYTFYAPSSQTYYAFYNPAAQVFSYYTPNNGYYAASYALAPTVSVSTADFAAPVYSAFMNAPYVSPAVSAFFFPATSGGSSVVFSASNGTGFSLPVSVNGASVAAPTLRFSAPVVFTPAGVTSAGFAVAGADPPAPAVAVSPPQVSADPPSGHHTGEYRGTVTAPASVASDPPVASHAAQTAQPAPQVASQSRGGDAARYAPPAPSNVGYAPAMSPQVTEGAPQHYAAAAPVQPSQGSRGVSAGPMPAPAAAGGAAFGAAGAGRPQGGPQQAGAAAAAPGGGRGHH